MEDLSRHQQLGRTGPKELTGEATPRSAGDRARERTWGSVAFSYTRPIIVLFRSQSIDTVRWLRPREVRSEGYAFAIAAEIIAAIISVSLLNRKNGLRPEAFSTPMTFVNTRTPSNDECRRAEFLCAPSKMRRLLVTLSDPVSIGVSTSRVTR